MEPLGITTLYISAFAFSCISVVYGRIVMAVVTDLPTEILWKLLEECPRELRSVSRQFYRLHNELYREKTLQLVPRESERNIRFWQALADPLVKYVKSLDFLRQHARLLVTFNDLEFGEYIEDSWYIIYNALMGPLKCANHSAPSRDDRDSLDYQKPIFTGTCIVPSNRKCAINAWFYVDNLFAARKLATLVTEFRDSPYDSYQTLSNMPNIADFIDQTGVYCFNLGKLPRLSFDDNSFPTCLEVRLVERSMTPPTYFENPHPDFLGYDFNEYDTSNSWLFFRIDETFKSTIFNPFETYLAESLVRLNDKCRFQTHRISGLNEVKKPYYDPDVKALRHFAYRFPRTKQDFQRERALPDWRAPRLRN